MNQQQSVFLTRALKQLSQVVEACCANGSTASETLGRKKIGRHIVVVRLIAEIDKGFSAPLSSHANSSHGSDATGSNATHSHVTDSTAGSQVNNLGAAPDYSKQTEHHNTQRGSRWHKPIF